MKKLFYIFALVAFALTSCNKNEVSESKQTSSIEQIKAKSIKLSQAHDSLVSLMLAVEKNKVIQKAKSTNNSNATLDVNEMLDVINEVTGVKPIILTGNKLPASLQKVKQNSDSIPTVDLSSEQVTLASYANSKISEKYLNLIDEVLQNDSLIISEKTKRINDIQNQLTSDTNATLSDIEEVLSGAEVLKGSMILWNGEFNQSSHVAILGKYNASGPVTWNFWKKLAFVSGADAVGAVLGFFAGGIITVGTVPVYVPPGPGGVAASAAAISYIAAKMCGW